MGRRLSRLQGHRTASRVDGTSGEANYEPPQSVPLLLSHRDWSLGVSVSNDARSDVRRRRRLRPDSHLSPTSPTGCYAKRHCLCHSLVVAGARFRSATETIVGPDADRGDWPSLRIHPAHPADPMHRRSNRRMLTEIESRVSPTAANWRSCRLVTSDHPARSPIPLRRRETNAMLRALTIILVFPLAIAGPIGK